MFGGFKATYAGKFFTVLAICVQLAAIFSPAVATAATDSPAPSSELNLTTSPLPISLVAKPGSSVSTDLRIKNSGATTEQLQVGLLKFGAFGDTGKPELLDFGPQDTYSKWVTFSTTRITAEPNVWNTVHMTINLPKSAAFGYYYAVTFSRVKNQSQSGQTAASLKGATAILVLLEAQVPNARKEASVADFVSTHGVYEFLPANFNVRVRNTGNIHLAPHGNVFIMKGKQQIGVVDINQDLGNVLPASNRVFEANWTDGFPHYADKKQGDKYALDKRGHHISQLKWNLGDVGKMRFGHYTADLLMIYDNGKQDVPIEAQLSFWVIPWRILLAITVLVGIICYALWTMFGSFRRGLRRPRKR
jgi:hypothetical protein